MAKPVGTPAGAPAPGEGAAKAAPPVGEEGEESGFDGEPSDGNEEGEEDQGEEQGENFEDPADWDESYVSPLSIRFTQEKIHPFFYRRGPIVNVVPKIRPVLHSAGEDLELVPPFSPIHCLRKGSELWSLDNRRLYALQLAAMEQWPRQCKVRVLVRDRLPRHKFKTQYRKFNTTSQGQSIDVCARFQQFDTWNWFERAVELEWYTLSVRLGTLFSVFEVVPVVGALLFRTGLTGFASRVPFMVAFGLTFTVDFLRQKLPRAEKKICELHVRAVMEGDIKHVMSCPRRQEDDFEEPAPSTAAQLAAVMSLGLLLVLPYILGLPFEKLRSSLLSCWLGVACVLVVQLATALRGRGGSDTAAAALTPKHRD